MFQFFESENYKSHLPPETKFNGGRTKVKLLVKERARKAYS
jgi:hypothetical protein